MSLRKLLSLAVPGLLVPVGGMCAGLGMPVVDLVTSIHQATLNVSNLDNRQVI